jgi:hypothetical protein
MADFIRMNGAFKKEFSPLEIQDLSFWIDASDLSTLSISSISPPTLQVDEWRDKGPNGYDLIQPTTSRKGEFLQNEQNGKNAIGFSDGDYMGNVSTLAQNLFGPNADTFTYFMVNKTPLNNVNAQFGFNFYADLNNTGAPNQGTQSIRTSMYFSNSTQRFFIMDSPINTARYLIGIGAENFGIYNYNSFVRNGTSHEGFINGNSLGTSTISGVIDNALIPKVLSVGEVSNSTPTQQEQIAEIIIYKRSLTTDEINKVHGYLSNKYNI